MTAIDDKQIRIRRSVERARYDRADIDAILDAGFVCQVATVRDGAPVVIPTLYARDGDTMILHGSPAAGMFRDSKTGGRICVSVTHVDGIVLARSAFHHSVNYRSVVAHGRPTQIVDNAEKLAALETLIDHIAEGQWDATRRPSADEMRQTDVWRMPLDQASAKVRTGGPKDDLEDIDPQVWAGVLPLTVSVGALIADDTVAAGLEAPAHLQSLTPPA